MVGSLFLATGLFVLGLLFGRQLVDPESALRLRFLAAVEQSFDALVISLEPDDVFRLGLICGMLGAGAGILVASDTGPLGALVIGVAFASVGYYAPQVALKILAAKRKRKFVSQFPDALGMMCRALGSGAGLQDAMELVRAEMPPPVSEEVRICLAHQQAAGVSLPQAVQQMLCVRMKSAETDMFAMLLQLSAGAGGDMVAPLSNLAKTLRDRLNMERKVRSLTSQVRMEGLVVGLAPAFLFLMMHVMAPDFTRPFLASPIGILVFGVVAVLEALGVYFMWKLSQIEY